MSNWTNHFSRVALIASLSVLALERAVAQRSAAATAARPPAYKGIFEPVPYPADVALTDVFFVTPDVGWASGGNALTNGVIIHTKDAGATWTVQLGDPESSEPPYSQLRFVDGRTGFAVQRGQGADARLLRTTDGENWKMVGTIPDHRTDYAFLSASTGVVAYGTGIRRTEDAGRTWKEVFACLVKVQVDGLTRDARCHLHAFHFPTRRVGYAIGRSYDAPGVFIAKTEDAGVTWSAWQALPEESGHESHLFFTDVNRGSACLYSAKFAATEDGGRTWSTVPGPVCEGRPDVRFSDPDVGWSVKYGALNFTVDGGRRWSGRAVRFPAMVNAFTLPRRDRAYVVGDHGMVYRYRIVPASTPPVPNEVVAPVMPGVVTVLDERVAELDATVAALAQALEAAPDSLTGAAAAAAGATAVASDSTIAEGGADDALASAADSTGEPVPVPSADLPAASPYMAACCGKPQGRARVLFSAIVAALPQLLEKQRNTNTLGATLLMLVELPLKVKGMRSALATFWKAPDKAAAQQALADVAAAAGALKQTTAMAFQRTPVVATGSDDALSAAEPAATPAPAGPAPAAMAQSLGVVDSASARPAGKATEADSANKAAGKVTEAAKKGLGGLIKKKIKIPS